MKNVTATIIVIVVLVGAGLFVMSRTSSQPQTTNEPTVGSPIIQSDQQQATTMEATFTTNKGVIVLELYGDKTPVTVQNFAKLAQEGFYDNTKFHRVIEDFMIQGGDPLTKDDSQQAMWGTGGPGYQFEDEIVPELSNVTGTISMANAGSNTNGSQFFINVADNTFLDGKHAVFGHVTAGMETVMEISKVAKNQRDVPNDPVIIESVKIIEAAE